MFADANLYPPFWMSPLRLVVVLAVMAGAFGVRILTKRLLRWLALREQRKLTQQVERKDPKLVASSLQQLANLYAAYERRELSASVAVEQASALVRETYDTMMNHKTRYQARYEIAARRLEKLGDLVKHSYPVEFAGTDHEIPREAVSVIFSMAREVLESCR